MGGKIMTVLRWLVGSAGLLVAQASLAQASSRTIAPPGSPSNATATVSPTSVAQALNPPERSAPSFDMSLGTSLVSGHFGLPTRSSIWSTAFGARFAVGGLRITGSVPWMRVRSATRIFTGIDSTPVLVGGAPLGPRRTVRGFGDLTLGAAYTLSGSPDGLEVEVSGRVKLPTASDASLKSGKVDYSAGVQVTKVIGGGAPYASVTYRIFGDPRGLDLKNGFAASAGLSASVGPAVLLGSYHYAHRASSFVGDSHELFGGASIPIASRLRGTAFVTKGLANGAAAVSGGIGLSLAL